MRKETHQIHSSLVQLVVVTPSKLMLLSTVKPDFSNLGMHMNAVVSKRNSPPPHLRGRWEVSVDVIDLLLEAPESCRPSLEIT
jgi:hypothetical protein